MPPWSQVFCSADLVCSKQKGDSQTYRRTCAKQYALWQNCWTLRVDITNLKNNSGVPGTICLVIFIGWDTMSLHIVTKFQEDLVRTVWFREWEQTNQAAIHGCSHVAFFKWTYNQRNITQHVDLHSSSTSCSLHNIIWQY